MRRVGASVSRLAASPLPARRTGRADFPHPALIRDHALRPRKAPHSLPRRVRHGRPSSSGERTSPRPLPGGRDEATGRAGLPFPTPRLLSGNANRRAASPVASACSAIRSPRARNGGTRRSPLSTALSFFLRSSRTKAPSLCRSYPASALPRAHPPPCRPKLALAGSRLARARHRQGFPCCCFLPLPYVPAPLPRRKRIGAHAAHFPTRRRPSPS